MKIASTVSLALVALLSPGVASAQHEAHHAADTASKLGTVHFPTSCVPAAAPTFDRGIALLHSFEFGAAIQSFDQVLAADSSCAMAHWGIAMSRWGNPMAVGARPPARIKQGKESVDAARRVASKATSRERDYIEAVGTLFDSAETIPHLKRMDLYVKAMQRVVERNPADTEAKIFHALAMAAAASPTDKTYAAQRAAGRELEALWAKNPQHPGLAHYIIHSYDSPALAAQAAAAARRYAAIAPDAAHALHMPSHIFTRTGQWKESIETNSRSMRRALSTGSIAEALHAADYMMYADLQLGLNDAAKRIVDTLPALRAKFDPNAITGAAPGSAGVFALAAIPARWVMERRAWKEAAALQPVASAWPYTEAMTYLVRAIGGTQVNDLAMTRASIDSLASIQRRLAASNEGYWAEQVAIQHLEAQAWLDLAEGRSDSALAKMREAVTREDATEKSAVTPGPLAPAHELLGDMYLKLGRRAEARAEYRETLKKEPGRRHSVRARIG